MGVQLFEALLPGVSWTVFDACKGTLPEMADSYEGILITVSPCMHLAAARTASSETQEILQRVPCWLQGSHYSVYENQPWIGSLKNWCCAKAASSDNVRMVGLCFGAQLLTQAFGGKADKHPDGRFILKGRPAAARHAHDNFSMIDQVVLTLKMIIRIALHRVLT